MYDLKKHFSELKKIILSKNILKISEDTFSLEILKTIFPQLVNLNCLGKLNDYSKNLFNEKSFVFLISYLIIDDTDNANYFLFKYNLSNENKKRIKFLIDNYYLFSENDYFSKKNLQRIYYFNDKSYVIDLLDLKIFNSKDSERKKVFENNIKNDATLVFFESPKRLVKTLSVMQKIYPSHRRAVICREMTKKHEEVIRGSISEILSKVSSRDIKGEICLVIEGDKDLIEPSIDLDNEIKDLILRKMSPSEAAKLLSSITQQNKRDLYKWLTKKS